MLGMTEESKRQHGFVVLPIEESEIKAIQPFISALQQEGWIANIDYKVDYTSNDFYSKPWRYLLEFSQSDGRRFLLEVFKRPHSKGFFKSKFLYSVKIAQKDDTEIEILGYIADINHLNALIQSFNVYEKKAKGFGDEFEALFTTNPDKNLLMDR